MKLRRPGSNLAFVAFCGAWLTAEAIHAMRAGATDQPIGAPFSAAVEACIRVGAALTTRSARVGETAWIGALGVATAIVGVWLLRRRAHRTRFAFCVAAFAIAALAQTCVLSGSAGLGIVLYGLAAVVYAVRFPRSEPLASENTANSGDWLGLAAGVVLFTLFALHRLDVYPPPHIDESTYQRAAEMQLGRIERERLVSHSHFHSLTFEQYRAQRVPLLLQAAGLAVFDREQVPGGGRLAVRLVSLVTTAFALIVAALALRRPLGTPAATVMLVLAACAPLTLAFARAGFYISISMLHGALAFAALLTFQRQRTPLSASALGGLLGSSLYFYQLSWFVPVFSLATLAAAPSQWRTRNGWRLGAIVVGTATLVALPGLFGLQEGLSKVASQTFDRVAELPGSAETVGATGAIGAPSGTGADADAGFFDRLPRSAQLRVTRTALGDRPVVLLQGNPALVREAIDLGVRNGWEVLVHEEPTRSAPMRAARIVSQLFQGPVRSGAVQWTDVPLLDPLSAPLIVLGLTAALLRFREPVPRALLIWVVGGALLPAMAGAAVPRRVVLAVPFAWALAALPLLEIGGLARGRAGRLAARVSLALLLVAIVSLDAHFYFERWREGLAADARPARLEVEKAMKGIPAGEPVLVAGSYPEFDRAGVVQHPNARSPERLRELSCAMDLPFTWVGPSASLRALERDFEIRWDERVGVALARIRARKPDGCVSTELPDPRH